LKDCAVNAVIDPGIHICVKIDSFGLNINIVSIEPFSTILRRMENSLTWLLVALFPQSEIGDSENVFTRISVVSLLSFKEEDMKVM
jgi:hypothetical protein